ncbi:putative membrane protein [Streptacidiphilus sp. MAP12-33]|uniref:vitamin K epoxide reductase family protein n=1 Tax=Streptacidiphilus sp. MAP12-33 TaxID=3156266 RepID=UPI0035183567
MTPSPARATVGASRPFALLLTLGGALGLLASTVLTVDQIKLLRNPDFHPGCGINSVLSCTDVMKAWQGELLGFPNAVLGIAAFAALTALGALLLTGVLLPRRIWLGLAAGAAGGAGFALWLASQCLYVIGALCPWCMVVWTVTLAIAWYAVLRTAELYAPVDGRLRSAVRLAREFHWTVPVLLYGTLTILVYARFG